MFDVDVRINALHRILRNCIFANRFIVVTIRFFNMHIQNKIFYIFSNVFKKIVIIECVFIIFTFILATLEKNMMILFQCFFKDFLKKNNCEADVKINVLYRIFKKCIFVDSFIIIIIQ